MGRQPVGTPAPVDRAEQAKDGVVTRSQTRAGFRLELVDGPHPVEVNGRKVGLRCTVRLYQGIKEIPIDNERVFINPPLKDRTRTLNPDGAFWEILWDSVDDAPNPGEWRRA